MGPAVGWWLAQLPTYSKQFLAFKVTRGAWASPALRREAEPAFWGMVGGMLELEPSERLTPQAAPACNYLPPAGPEGLLHHCGSASPRPVGL